MDNGIVFKWQRYQASATLSSSLSVPEQSTCIFCFLLQKFGMFCTVLVLVSFILSSDEHGMDRGDLISKNL